MVLLRNEPVGDAPLLPLTSEELTSIALIGPNAARAQIMGGGSAYLRPFHRTSPLDAFAARLGNRVTITHADGCNIDVTPPLLSGADLVAPDGRQGFRLEVFDNADWSGEPVGTTSRDTSRLVFGDEPVHGIPLTSFSVRATGTFTPSVSGEHALHLVQVSPARVLVDGEVVLDGVAEPAEPSTAFFGFGGELPPATRRFEAGTSYELVIEMVAKEGAMFNGLDLRVRPPADGDAFGRAVDAAAAADVAVVVVGTNDDWETEGEDRTSLALPGDQDALVASVLEANPRTVVVVNAGSPVLMPFADDAPAILLSWLGGQEMGDALIDVLTGEADPGGRLPTTFPRRIEHSPSYGNFPGDNGQVPYAESILMGYRWYDSRHLPVLFPFGHGLSYTSFEVGSPALASASVPVGAPVTVEVPVTNTGDRRGSHVVQCYVRPHASRLVRPDKELKTFAKVSLDPGASTTVTLTLGERAFAYWDPGQPEWPQLQAHTAATLPQLQGEQRRTEAGWMVEPGRYDVVIANSAADVATVTTVELTEV
jgi:beta-glucosidase